MGVQRQRQGYRRKPGGTRGHPPGSIHWGESHALEHEPVGLTPAELAMREEAAMKTGALCGFDIDPSDLGIYPDQLDVPLGVS